MIGQTCPILQACPIEGMDNINGFVNQFLGGYHEIAEVHLLLVILISIKYVLTIYR